MKNIVILFVLFHLNTTSAMAQIIDYYPEQKAEVSDQDYKHGTMILRETYKKIKQYGGEIIYADYWNIAIAYFVLRQDPQIFKKLLYKSKELNPENFAEIFLDEKFGGKDASKWKGYLSEEEYQGIIDELNTIITRKKNNIVEQGHTIQAPKNTFHNEKLMVLFKELNEKDQKYRAGNSKDLEKQRLLDKENITVIDSLYHVYHRYIGKSLVGDKYKHVMWSIIQHSDLDTMEKYLPTIFEATKKGELKETMLQMLLDRIYTLKCDYQIYGTQIGIPIGIDDEVDEVIKKYKIYKNSTSKVNRFGLYNSSTSSHQETAKERRNRLLKGW